MNRLSKYMPSNEAIDHQYDGIFKQALINRIELIRKGTAKIDKAIADADLGKLIKVHTGIDVKIFISKGVAAYVKLTNLTPNHPIINNVKAVGWDSVNLNSYLSSSDITGGTVDLRKGKITGTFTNVEIPLYIGTGFITRRGVDSQFIYSAEEVAAAIMHEVGHAFTYFELIGRTVRTNYIVLAAVTRLTGVTDKVKRIEILSEVESRSGLKLGDIDKLSEINDNTAYTCAILQASDSAMRSELGTNLYDNTGAESLADQYTARQGLAVPLATLVSKLLRENGDRAFMSRPVHYLSNVVSFTMITFSIMTLPTSGIVWSLIKGALALGSISVFINSDRLSDSYDKPKERFERLRSQLVEQLKDRDIPHDIREGILLDVAEMDKLLMFVNANVHWLDFISEYVIPYKRKEVKQVEFQKGLERMLNNELFVTAAKLETLKI